MAHFDAFCVLRILSKKAWMVKNRKHTIDILSLSAYNEQRSIILEVNPTNTVVTSADAILSACKELAAQNGLQAVNIRLVAEKCNIAVGSVYHYFPSKADLIAATVEAVWKSIFHEGNTCGVCGSFVENVNWLFQSARKGAAEHPNFFTGHSLSFATNEKGTGKKMMAEYFGHMKAGLLHALQNDEQMKPAAFTSSFTQEAFVSFVFSSVITLLIRQETSCDLLLEIIKRVIYR
ncbi:MAG: helix-turn-helix domain-containing protein [Clostridia bacterium]